MFFLGVILLMYGSGVLASLVTPYGYNDQDLTNVKQGPSLSHPFGTDRLGRDQLTRVIFGLRTTVIITLTSLLVLQRQFIWQGGFRDQFEPDNVLP